MFELRPYQEESIQAVAKEWAQGHQRTLLVLPTGCGKTIVFCMITKNEVNNGHRVLILAHREELLHQAADKMQKVTGFLCATQKGEETCLKSDFPIVVGSIQTLQREKRLKAFPNDYFDTIIIDEAHHAMADGYQTVLNHFDQANVLGVTATPDRGDRRNLGAVFDSLAYEYSLATAIQEGFLCPIRALTIPLKLDITGVRVDHGEYKASDVDSALDPYLEHIAQNIADICAKKKTVIFLPLVKTARRMRDMLNEQGMRAAEVNGESPDRAEILRDFDEGKYNVLCNAMLLTEGWDCPTVDCVVVLRPTQSRSLYCQMVGRGTRLAPGKKFLLLLDFLWMTEKHSLCRPAHLIAPSAEIADFMTKRLETSVDDEGLDLSELANAGQMDVVKQREEALAKRLEDMKHRQRKLVDPLQYEISIMAEDLTNYQPSFKWEYGPVTKKQSEVLEKYGISADTVQNTGKASKLISRLTERVEDGLTTPRQIRFLESRGFQHVGTWKFDEANTMISRIADNHWMVPYGIIPAAYIPRSQYQFGD